MIRGFRKKKKWLNWRAEKEAEQKQAMAQKFDEDLRLFLQEEAKTQRLKVAQELRKEEERKLERNRETTVSRTWGGRGRH